MLRKISFFIASLVAVALILTAVHKGYSSSKEGYRSLAIEQSANKAFALNKDTEGIDVVDLKTGAIERTILQDKEIRLIAVDEQNKILVAAGDEDLYVVAAGTFEVLKTIPIGEEAVSLTLEPGTGLALLTREASRVSIIDLSAGKVITEIQVSDKPIASAVDAGLRIAVVAHQTWGEGSSEDKAKTRDNVTIIDLKTFAIIKTLQAGKNPRHVTVNPDTHVAVVANEKSNDLTVIDLSNLIVKGTIAVQKHPMASSFNVCLNTLSVVGGEDSSWLQVLDLDSGTVKASTAFDKKINDVTVHSALNKAVIAGKGGLFIRDLPNPVPDLISLSPDNASRGGNAFTVTVTGKGLLSITELFLNGNKTQATYVGCGTLKMEVPAEYLARTGQIEVKASNPAPGGGASNLLYLNVVNPIPSIVAIQPSEVMAGTPSLTLNLTGIGFFNDTTISINNVQRTFTLISQNQLQIGLTASDLDVGGYLDITASNPLPGGGISALAKFTVVNPVPVLTSIDPSSVQANSGDTAVVITGSNFVKTSTVSINNQSFAAQFTNSTRMQVTVPASMVKNSGSYPVKVVNPQPGGSESETVTLAVSASKPAVEPLPEGSFGKQYEDLIPQDVKIKAYTVKRFAIITGLVQDRNQKPMADVKVSLLGLSEYGTARTDSSGRYSIPVDGGGAITVAFEKAGMITSHRQIDTPWNNIVNTDTVTLIPQDTKATTITFDGDASKVMVHTSTMVSDTLGIRSLTMVFTGDNRATITDANGQQKVMTSITTRATEFDTPASMPAKLPPTSGYTYCSELSVDGAMNVKFAKPVTFYVDNFLGFDVGAVVPVGYYDRQRGVWVGSDNGVVVKLLDTNNDGIVDALDTVGDGLPHDYDVAGLSDSSKFKPNSTYWKVKVDHFSPWDCNCPFGPPADAIRPNPDGNPVSDQQKASDDIDCNGSYCERTNRIVHEDIKIPGTDTTLHYASNRVRGYKTTVSIPASGATVPASLTKIIVKLEVAGRVFETTLPPQSNQKVEFAWDGLDFVGNRIIGSTAARISIGFGYTTVYYTSPQAVVRAWALSGIAPTRIQAREEMILWKVETIALSAWASNVIADGWTISSNHFLSPRNTNVLMKGDGTTIINSIRTIASVASVLNPTAVAGDSAGNKYVIDLDGKVWKIDGNGVKSIIVKSGLGYPRGLAVDGVGNIYVADQYAQKIWKVKSNGFIMTVAGTGVSGYSGDGGPAIQAKLSYPNGVAVDAAGNIYIADSNNCSIRKVDTSGIISTVAGNGQYGYSGDGGSALKAKLYVPSDVAVDNAGNIYMTGGNRIRKVDITGIITTIAGNDNRGYSGDGGLATLATLYWPIKLAVDNSGNVFIADAGNRRIRQINAMGVIATVAGNGKYGQYAGNGGPAGEASISTDDVDIDPSGSIYIADYSNSKIWKVAYPDSLKKFAMNEGDIPFSEENGLGHIMSMSGLHKATIDLATGKAIRTFGYNNNKVVSVTDRFGNQTTIQRDADGTPKSITSPDGIVTGLTIDSSKHLTKIAYPDESSYRFDYTTDGLLTDTYDPRSNYFSHKYDLNGRITDVYDPENGHWNYSRREDEKGNIFSTIQTGEDNATLYHEHTDPAGAYTSIKVDPTGEMTTISRSSDQLTEITTASCKMNTNDTYNLDTEYMFKYLSATTTNSPAGLRQTREYSKNYQDADADTIPDLITEIVSINSKTWTTTNNVLAGTITYASPMGRAIISQYNSETLLTEQLTVPGQYSTIFDYDLRGRLVTSTTGSRTSSIVYGANGFPDYVTTADNKKYDYTYDAIGRLRSVLQPGGAAIEYDYDANGNMTLLTKPNTVSNVFDYTATNLRKTWTTALSGNYQYAYDTEKNLKSITFPSGKVINNTYKNALLTGMTMPEGSVALTYSCGNLPGTIAKGNEKIAYDYDGSLLKSDTRTGTINQKISYTYNNDFKVSSVSYGGVTQSIGYDSDGLLTSAGIYTITRNTQNGLPQAVSDGKLTLTRNYSGYGEMDENTYAVSGNQVYSWNLIRDNAGRITQKTENMIGSAIAYNYTYDELGRLMTVKKDGVAVESYTYDPDGNRLTEENSLIMSSKTYSYSTEDHIITAGADRYQFDKDGFLTSRITSSGTTTFNYSSRGELLSTILENGTTISYDHDPRGRRIAKRINGTIVEKYLWRDATRLLAVYDGNDTLSIRFTYADARMPVSMVKGGVTYYLLYDQIGSLRAVVDANGALVKDVLYDSFGSIIYDTNPKFTMPFGFAGGLQDRDTGLVRFGARDYDPALGRWTAKDPIDFAGGDVNLYGYVRNNPVRFIDPYGLSATDDFLNWLGTVLGVVNPEPLVAPIAGALTDPNVPKLAILEKVNLYNLEQADKGTDNYIQPSWADQHPLEAWKIIIDYENEKKEKGTCPK